MRVRLWAIFAFMLLAIGVFAEKVPDTIQSRLGHAYRFDRGGWVYVHLEGKPEDIGFQHGYLLAP